VLYNLGRLIKIILLEINMVEKEAPKLETHLVELEKIVAAMESENFNLDDSLKMFERGIELTKQCQHMLAEAEKKITKLVDDATNNN
jgi:exodeoxyribonuclease VII small subunit